MGATINFEHIYKSYGQTKVIKCVDLDIDDGDFLTILGPSGAGKTTLLKMLAGFEDPTEGEILVNGEDISKKPIHKRNIGMLFQNYALFPHMTVLENVAFPLAIRKVKKAERNALALEMLKKVRLEGYEKRFPRELSGGQQQRVAMARALVFKPSVLLLDEPMAALDKQLRKQMQIEIRKIHDELGITTISVTHDQEEALTMATKVCVMKDGMVEQVATPVEIYERPRSVFCAKFIGEANVVEGQVKKVSGDDVTMNLYDDTLAVIKDKSAKNGKTEYNVGNTVHAVIRPEKIQVVDDKFDGIKFKGKIEQAIYVGDVLKLKVRLECGKSMKVKVFTQYSLNLNEGDVITVGMKQEDMVLVSH